MPRTRNQNAYYVVTNVGRRDLAWVHGKLAEWNTASKDGAVEHELLANCGLLALQGVPFSSRPAHIP